MTEQEAREVINQILSGANISSVPLNFTCSLGTVFVYPITSSKFTVTLHPLPITKVVDATEPSQVFDEVLKFGGEVLNTNNMIECSTLLTD